MNNWMKELCCVFSHFGLALEGLSETEEWLPR